MKHSGDEILWRVFFVGQCSSYNSCYWVEVYCLLYKMISIFSPVTQINVIWETIDISVWYSTKKNNKQSYLSLPFFCRYYYYFIWHDIAFHTLWFRWSCPICTTTLSSISYHHFISIPSHIFVSSNVSYCPELLLQSSIIIFPGFSQLVLEDDNLWHDRFS